jgi:hypothetical protein
MFADADNPGYTGGSLEKNSFKNGLACKHGRSLIFFYWFSTVICLLNFSRAPIDFYKSLETRNGRKFTTSWAKNLEVGLIVAAQSTFISNPHEKTSAN